MLLNRSRVGTQRPTAESALSQATQKWLQNTFLIQPLCQLTAIRPPTWPDRHRAQSFRRVANPATQPDAFWLSVGLSRIDNWHQQWLWPIPSSHVTSDRYNVLCAPFTRVGGCKNSALFDQMTKVNGDRNHNQRTQFTRSKQRRFESLQLTPVC
jgi:hypothetical protein